MAVQIRFDTTTLQVLSGIHRLGTDNLKVMLTNTLPNVATATVKADITEISAGNGYPAGGLPVTTTSLTQTGGVAKLVLADPVLTATGGAIGPYRYAVLYNDSQTTPAKPLLFYSDYGSSITTNAGETLTVDFDGVAGAITL